VTGLGKYTPVRLAVPFCAGIIISISIGHDLFRPVTIALIVSFVLFLITNLLSGGYSTRWLPGLLATISLFSAGMAMAEGMKHNAYTNDKVMAQQDEHAVRIICLTEKPLLKTKSLSGKAKVLCYLDSLGKAWSSQDNILLYIENDSVASSLAVGDLILARGSMEEVGGPLNPESFDYRKFLYYRNVRWQAVLDSGEWKKIVGIRGVPLLRWSEGCRQRFGNILASYGISGDELALASALILGTRDLLQKDMIREFSNAGAIHVLSVSGLHVGIMFVLADRMLFFLKRFRRGRKLHQAVIILMIWVYAFITGLPASVVRASLMFSLIAAARMMDRSHEGFNILAGALLVQLWINPFEITQVGFQLSYLAVLGIFAYYKKLNEIWANSSRLIAEIWSIIAVSIAAQLATFPLASYYFHFFPVYFLVTNMVVVPLAGVVTYMALFVLLAGIIHLPFTWIGLPLKWGLQLMHGSVAFIQSWPGAVLKPVNLTSLQVLLIFLFLCGLFIYFILLNHKGLWMSVISMSLILLIAGSENYKKSMHPEVVVYSLNGHTAIEYLHDRHSVFLADSSLLTLEEKINMQVAPNRMHLGIRTVNAMEYPMDSVYNSGDVWICPPFYTFGNLEMAIIGQEWQNKDLESKVRVDWLVVTGKKGPSPEQVIAAVSPSCVIADGSVPGYRADRWEAFCKANGLQFHSVLQAGAMIKVW
jgi:competence protein ComEC